MLLTAIFGSMAAMSINAPNLLILMWALLFGSLGWNFLEYAFKGPDLVWGWLVCGVLFWLMAAPAVYLMLVALKNAVVPPRRKHGRRVALVGAGVRRADGGGLPHRGVELPRLELERRSLSRSAARCRRRPRPGR